MKKQTFLFKDIFDIRKGRKEKESLGRELRYIQIEDLRNDDNIKYCEKNDKNILIDENDLVIAWDGANAGIVGFGLSGAIGSTLGRLRLKENFDSSIINTHYIGYYLILKERYLKENATGATIPHVSRKSLENLKIKLPTLDVQDRIVAILKKVNAVKVLRQQQIETLSSLKKSVFVDMFGDPVKNDKDWTTHKLKDLGLLQRGKSKHRPRNAPELLNGPYPLIQTGDVPKDNLYITTYNQTYSELGLQQSKLWPTGTLCITIAANIAHTGILTFDACFPDSIVGFTPNENVSNVFISIWFSFLQRHLERNAPQSAQKNINLAILSDLDVITPSKSLQEQFENRIQTIEHHLNLVIKSLKEIEGLYNSLFHSAFNDELFKEEFKA